ncbi:MAG: hypothetical protein DRO40_08600 [Thermoprotei archaeon]|nr:MAG: hypothetical protein DRO40_08600 [Thermoprotei archaeon]
MSKKSKSDYKKLLDSLTSYSGIEEANTLDKYAESIKKIYEYIEGVPWNYMKPSNRAKLEGIIDEYIEKLKDEKRDYFLEKFAEAMAEYPRLRKPAYVVILDYLIDHPDVIEIYLEKPSRAYYILVEETGYAYKTVADSFWAFRRAGILE